MSVGNLTSPRIIRVPITKIVMPDLLPLSIQVPPTAFVRRAAGAVAMIYVARANASAHDVRNARSTDNIIRTKDLLMTGMIVMSSL